MALLSRDSVGCSRDGRARRVPHRRRANASESQDVEASIPWEKRQCLTMPTTRFEQVAAEASRGGAESGTATGGEIRATRFRGRRDFGPGRRRNIPGFGNIETSYDEDDAKGERDASARSYPPAL